MVLHRMHSPRTSAVALVAVLAAVLPLRSLAQSESVEPKVIVVPYPGMNDAGVVVEPPPVTPLVEQQPPPPNPPVEQPPPPPPPETRTIEANTPPTPPPVDPNLVPSNDVMGTPQDQPGAFLDGHPREGAFLSGPGSMTFVLHQTTMIGLGVLGSQMIPRAVEAYCIGQMGCTTNPETFTGPDARVAYLAGSLIGAGVGFGASAWWQFNHWISHRSANFGIINSFVGAAFVGGLTDLIAGAANATPRGRAEAVTWSILFGAVAGSWLSMIIGGGDIPMNKATLVVSGAGWAMIYTALIAGMIAAAGSKGDFRSGVDALLITPAIGAAAMAFATLKFNPSTMQIMRANLFGVGVGAAVFLLSGLVLGLNWGRDATGVVPYILGAVGAIGAKTIVSIFWVEAAEHPNANQPDAPGAPAPQNWALPAVGGRAPEKVSPWW
jgi:hypothetical protein